MAVVVPIDIQPQVTFAPPIVADFVVLSEDFHEVIHVVFSGIFYTKIIKAEQESYRAPVVCPKYWGDLTLVIVPLVQSFLE